MSYVLSTRWVNTAAKRHCRLSSGGDFDADRAPEGRPVSRGLFGCRPVSRGLFSDRPVSRGLFRDRPVWPARAQDSINK